LPSQVLEIGGKFSSRLIVKNFSKGRFEILLQNDCNLVINFVNLPFGYVNENCYESVKLWDPVHQVLELN